MPHEIFRANLSSINFIISIIYIYIYIYKLIKGLKIIECAPEDMKYFINLELLDLSEN